MMIGGTHHIRKGVSDEVTGATQKRFKKGY